MAKKNQSTATETEAPETTAVAVAAGAALPAYLQGTDREGFEGLDKYRIVPRMRIVQQQSKDELREVAGEGGVILRPDNLPVFTQGESVIAVPVFIFTTYEKWRDANDPEEGLVLAVSTDPASDLARRAQDASKWSEAYSDGSGLHYKYVESINAVLHLTTGPAAGRTAILSFNITAFPIGKQLVSMLRSRKVALYANRVEIGTTKRTKGRNSWWTPTINNPADGPFVSEEIFREMQGYHAEMVEAYNSGAFVFAGSGDDADHGESPDGGGETSGDEASPI